MQLTNVCIALVGSFCLFVANVLNPQTSIAATQDVNAHLTDTTTASMIIGCIGFLAISLSYGLGRRRVVNRVLVSLCSNPLRPFTITRVL